MVELNSVVNTLTKSMDETLNACKFSIVHPDGVIKDEPSVKIEGDIKTIVFTSEVSSIKFEISNNKCVFYCANVNAKEAESKDYKKQFESLLELDSEECNVNDIKSLANEANFSIVEFFGVGKKNNVQKKSAAKKSGKKNNASYDTEGLAQRISSIYPELKEVLAENTEKYEMTLPEEFFIDHANPLIMASLKNGEKTKKLFNIFNTYYEEGPKDTQSMIAVTILGVNLKDDKELVDDLKEYMNKDLKLAVEGVVHYLNTVGGKKSIDSLENPKPYVPKRFNFKRKK